LKESEFRFRSFVENANDIVYALSPEGLFTYVSPNWMEFMGEPADAAIGKLFQYYVHPDDVHLCQEFLDKVLTSGQKQSSVEYRVKHTDGSWHWHVSNGSPMRDLDGTVTGYVGIARDVTERKQTEDALRESEEKFSKAFQSAPLLMTITSVDDGRFLDVNDAFVLLTGYSRETAIGSRSTEIGFAQIDERDRMVDILKTEGRVRNLELKVRRADGSQMVCLYSAEIFNLNGQERLLSTAIDITDQKQSEKAILESEERYRKLVNTAPYGIQLTDKEGKIVFSNPAHHKIQGYADGELIGKYIWELMADDQHRLKAKSFYQKLIKEQPLPEVYFNRDLTKDGREIDIQVNWDYILNSEGEVEGIISIISDITKQRALELSIQQAQKMESIGNLAGGIAHDFNNILFPIVGLSELLMEDLPPGSPENERIQWIFKSAERGSDLVKQILAFSRQTEHEMFPIRLQPILKEVLKLCRSTIPANIEIEQDIQTDCGPVLGDSTQIHQIGMNLITNAYHAVQEAGGRISVRLKEIELGPGDVPIASLRPGRYAKLTVEDSGTGIDPGHMEKIFDPYFTTKERGKGTGLGLAVAHGIIREHGGDIRVFSELGKGSVFHVYLPLIKDLAERKSLQKTKDLPKGHENILLVDDEESIVSLESQILKSLGYTVTTFKSPMDALKAFKAVPEDFDLVMTDMAMPKMNGVELAHELFKIRPNIPLIICTGFSEQINEQEASKLNIMGVLHKPMSKAEIAKMVRSVLDETSGKND
jgi:PAS domain S-box-containing protein